MAASSNIKAIWNARNEIFMMYLHIVTTSQILQHHKPSSCNASCDHTHVSSARYCKLAGSGAGPALMSRFLSIFMTILTLLCSQQSVCY